MTSPRDWFRDQKLSAPQRLLVTSHELRQYACEHRRLLLNEGKRRTHPLATPPSNLALERDERRAGRRKRRNPRAREATR